MGLVDMRDGAEQRRVGEGRGAGEPEPVKSLCQEWPFLPVALSPAGWLSMSVSVHETRKSRSSTGSMNITLFHKASHPDCVLAHLNTLRKHRMFTDVTLWAGDRAFSLSLIHI